MEAGAARHTSLNPGSPLRGIEERVRLARTILTREIVGGGLLRLVTMLTTGFVAGVALHLMVRSGTAVAWGLTLALLAGLGTVVWRFLLRPLASRPGDDGFVEWLDRRLAPPGAPADARKNLIVTAWQLGRSMMTPQTARPEFAPDLVEAIVQRGAAAAATVPVDRWRDRSTDRRWLATLGLALVAGLALFLVSGPRRFGLAASKVIDPRRAELVPPGIDVAPGDLTVEKGEDVALAITVRGTRETPLLRVRETGGNWMTRRLETPAVAAEAPEVPLNYASVLKDVERDLEYEVQVGRLESSVYRVTVNEPPRVGGFEITYAYPDYTGRPPETVTTGTGDMAVLVGTRVRLKVLANRSMPTAWMVTGPIGATDLTDRRALTGAGASGGDFWETTFTVEESFDYTVSLGDLAGGEKFTSGRFHLEAVPDRAPVVRLLYPAGDMKIPEEMNLTLQGDGVDDFGLTRLDLVYQIKDGKAGRMRLKEFRAGQAEFQSEFPWDLVPFNLSPGMEVSYFLELFDNDTIHGPKVARSDVRHLRFPTMDEIYAEVHEEHGEQIDDLSSALEKSEELKKEVEKLSREMKRDGENSWDKQKEIENLLQKQQELQQQLQDTAKSLEETLNKAQEETLMNPELLQKMQEIAQLMQSIQNEKIKEAFQKLSEAMKNLDKDAVNKAMDEIKLDQEQMAQSIERTLEMLKEIRKEEMMEDAVRKAEELARQQEELARKMEQEKKDGSERDKGKDDARKGDTKDPAKDGEKKDSEKKDGARENEAKDQAGKEQNKDDGAKDGDDKSGKPSPEEEALAKEQEAIKKQAEELRKQIEELEKMAANEPELKQDLKEAQQNEENSEMRQDMEQSQQKMQQGDMEKALKFSFKARDKAKQLSQMLNQAQQESNAAKKRELQERMMQVIQDLVDISSAQEELLAQAEAVDDGELAQRQQVIAEGVVKAGVQLEALGKRTLFIPQGQQSRLTTALNKMKNATRSLSGGNRNVAMRDGKESAGDLNEAIVELMQANEGMCNMPSSSGMMESMQKMQSLSQQQQDLNGQTKSSQSMGSSPRLGQGKNEQLERLAAQQEMIQKGLNEVGGELEGRKDVLGRLDQLAQEMADVAAELRKNGVDERLLERQQKILSRMLDAQRSIRKRDDDNQRESKTAEQLFRPGGPPPLTREQLMGPERLRSDILKGQSDSYPSQYRALVEQYFRALSQRKGGATGGAAGKSGQ